MPKHHLIVIDPTAFSGGSKVATENILRLLDTKQIRITVLTADPHSWRWPQLKRVHLYQPKWLASKEQGVTYFLRHIYIVLNLLLTRLRFGRFDVALGASGPGVDLALYLLKSLFGIKVIQLIHGPVARSRTIARCLLYADAVHYLESCQDSLLTALSCISVLPRNELPSRFHVMENGLSEHAWPTICQTHYPSIFWAASLLKWKGLDTLLAALRLITPEMRPVSHICYIKPQATVLDISQAPVALEQVNWYEDPANIDPLRASANIFVSTSTNEPFGLSILEAMAAGHCVLIPADGAYWDRTLSNNVNCIKYQAGDACDLAHKLMQLSQNMPRIIELGNRAAKIARDYQAQNQYANIKRSLEAPVGNPDTQKTLRSSSHE